MKRISQLYKLVNFSRLLKTYLRDKRENQCFYNENIDDINNCGNNKHDTTNENESADTDRTRDAEELDACDDAGLDENEHLNDNTLNMNIDNNDHSALIDFDDESNAVLLIQHNIIKQLRNLDNCFNTSNTKGDKTY